MRICRVASYPDAEYPGSGLVPYFLSFYINEQTLYLTRRRGSKVREVPSHVTLKRFKADNKPFSPKIRQKVFSDSTDLGKMRLQMRVIQQFRGVGFALKCIPLLSFFRPDIIHCHSMMNIYQGIFSHVVLRSKFVLGIHNESEIALIKRLPMLKQLLNRCCDAIICVSNNITVQAKKYLNVPVYTVPTGVDLGFFKPSSTAREKRISTIGAFKWKKGHSDMLSAFKMVSDAFPDYKFTMVGKGEEKNKIVKIIKELKLSGVVEIVSQLDYRGIRDLLSRSKIFVLSSIYEGFPKVVLEAMACGTPVVVTNKCNVSSLIARGVGLETPAGSPQEHSRAIIELLDNQKLWSRASSKCIEVAKNYDWNNSARKTYNIYNKLLKQRVRK